jgi:DNA polymerase IV
MNIELEKIASTVQSRLKRYQLKGRTITLKIKYHDFKQITRSHSLDEGTDDLETIESTAKTLLNNINLFDKKIRLLGISLSNFVELTLKSPIEEAEFQLKLF